MPFPDPKGDGDATALSMGPLVYHKSVETYSPGKTVCTTTISVGMTPVAVEKDDQRRSVLMMIIPAVKENVVVRSDGNCLVRVLGHGMGHPVNIGCYSFVLITL